MMPNSVQRMCPNGVQSQMHKKPKAMEGKMLKSLKNLNLFMRQIFVKQISQRFIVFCQRLIIHDIRSVLV
ncbi:hypothetical protein AT243_06535 [Bartonella henselae]|nr:hypothetical protein AT243_06535 [Bartonella henselae]